MTYYLRHQLLSHQLDRHCQVVWEGEHSFSGAESCICVVFIWAAFVGIACQQIPFLAHRIFGGATVFVVSLLCKP